LCKHNKVVIVDDIEKRKIRFEDDKERELEKLN
jgi:hypothetical protein